MKETDGVNLRSIRWTELFPWLAIGRCFRLAIAPRMMILGALGITATLVGWWVLAWAFGADGKPHPWFRETFPGESPQEFVGLAVADSPNAPNINLNLESIAFAVRTHCYLLTSPFYGLLSLKSLEWRDRSFLILAALLSIGVWGYCGGAISRIAAVQLAGDEKLGFIAATRWACKKWLSYCAAPLFPLLGVALAAIPLWFVGLLQNANVGVLITGPLWILALACGFFMAILLAGLAYGWPLMWATISVEGTDSFDALSRTYAYVFQRPLRYALYIVVAAVVGLLGMIVVYGFASAVLWLTSWGVSLGSGGERAQEILLATHTMQIPPDLDSFSGRAGVACIAFWQFVVKCLALGYVYAYFWSASTSIYLLLRRDVDATEMDELFLDADASERAAPLPPITSDAAGAPEVAVAPEKVVPPTDGQPAKPDAAPTSDTESNEPKP